MITLDQLRQALRQPQPWTALDALVRAEQAAGRKAKEIHDELRALVEPVRALESPPEDADDAMMDTLDALAGNCGPESAYRDPPNNTLPTEEEIAKLPRWARVAFAARCARRVLPLLSVYWHPIPTGHFPTLEKAIQAAETAAKVAAYHGTLRDAAWPAGNVGDDTFAYFPVDDPIRKAVQHVAVAAQSAAEMVATDGTEGSPQTAVEAVYQATQAAAPIFGLQSVIRRDFDHLARLAQWQHWTDDTPVPPEVFGPLWPEGPPPGWPADPGVPQRADLPLAFLALDRVVPAVLEDETVNLFNALNRYHIARTGVRLTLEGDVRTLLASVVGAGV